MNHVNLRYLRSIFFQTTKSVRIRRNTPYAIRHTEYAIRPTEYVIRHDALFLNASSNSREGTLNWAPIPSTVGANMPSLLLEEAFKNGGRWRASTPTQYAIRPTQYAKCNTEYALCNTQYAIPPTQYAIRPTRYAIRPTPYAIRNTQYAIRNISFHIQDRQRQSRHAHQPLLLIVNLDFPNVSRRAHMNRSGDTKHIA